MAHKSARARKRAPERPKGQGARGRVSVGLLPATPKVLDQGASEKEKLAQFMVETKIGDFNQTRSVLEELRRTRKARGGVGAPLEVPAHLRTAADGKPDIVLTDADMPTPAPGPSDE